MNKAEIFYFSGSGNSLAVARDIAGEIDAKLTEVTSVADRENINCDAGIVGFVFPIYDFKHPSLIEKTVKKFKNLDTKYIFAVCTFGIDPSNAMKIFDKLIKSCEGELAGGFTVRMPHNGIGSGLFSKKQHELMFNNWKIKLRSVKDYILKREKGRLETSNMPVNIVFSGILFRMIPIVLKLITVVLMKGWESLTLTCNEKCDGCGICEKICPVNNIQMIDNRPSWLTDKCMGCFSCFHWCPREAVKTGKINMNMKNYHHPDVRISDILDQRMAQRIVGSL